MLGDAAGKLENGACDRYTRGMNPFSRREFLAASTVSMASLSAAGAQPGSKALVDPVRSGARPVSIASANGQAAVARAMELLKDGYDPADAVVQGVRIVEDDPKDNSVGLGGLPNADGVVELDASVMHGPTHKSGAVASVQRIKNVAMLALLVLRRTDHCLIVGDGARRFALSHGFKEEDLLTEESRKAWMKWRENLSKDDDWLNDDERDAPAGNAWSEPGLTAMSGPVPYTTGTIHCSAVTPGGDVASCTTTSGLSWKIPGRVGDSPIIGAGNYCDNAVGAGGCTGRGEAAIVNLSAYTIVMAMERGLSPTDACLEAAKRMVDRTKEKRLLAAGGKPNFNVRFYALRKDGAHGSAAIFGPNSYAVADAGGARIVETPSLFPGP
jgi:N4-(beta-N-acetylglucosaminyl)-L-asparaginase